MGPRSSVVIAAWTAAVTGSSVPPYRAEVLAAYEEFHLNPESPNPEPC